MRKTAFLVCVTLVVLAAAACKNAPTAPTASSPGLSGTGGGKVSTDKPPTINIEAFVGTWRATKAEVWRAPAPNVLVDRRDLVAEGGTVILALESQTYSVSVTMPGETTGVSTGRWHYHEFWGKPQIDFYLSSMKNPEWGEIPSFYVDLIGDTLTLRDGAPHFLPFDYGWDDPPGALPRGVLTLVVFTRM